MVASGVRNSCEAVETNLDFISESSNRRVWSNANGGRYGDSGNP